MKIEEGYLDVPGGKVWYRAVGDNAEATPLLCLHGGPGFTHYYLEPMNGPSEFTVTGTLKTWDVMDRLPEIGVRTLLVGGRYDECTPGHLEEMHRRMAGSQLVIIEDASHLCFAERPEEFNTVINSFMT